MMEFRCSLLVATIAFHSSEEKWEQRISFRYYSMTNLYFSFDIFAIH